VYPAPLPGETVCDDGDALKEKSGVATTVPARKAPTPFGEPSPVGPSKPGTPLQRYGGEQPPLDPVVTSRRSAECAYSDEAAPGLPPSAYAAATSGEERLVPPTWNQPDCAMYGTES
jgi:hypothetical protein